MRRAVWDAVEEIINSCVPPPYTASSRAINTVPRQLIIDPIVHNAVRRLRHRNLWTKYMAISGINMTSYGGRNRRCNLTRPR